MGIFAPYCAGLRFAFKLLTVLVRTAMVFSTAAAAAAAALCVRSTKVKRVRGLPNSIIPGTGIRGMI